MGEQQISRIATEDEKRAFTRHLLNDIKSLEIMLKEGMFESGIQRIGAEQEICLIGSDGLPSMKCMEILERINDPHYTTELAKYNLEINLDPLEFKAQCFAEMEEQLSGLLAKGQKAAAEEKVKILLTGILPTISTKELQFDYMTPNPRYRELNEVMLRQKGGDFELNIKGIDELVTKHPNILFEACNTSFQVHLQIEADDFVKQYNWSQAIAGPVLAVVANSPLLLGKRLWNETRIALFQQSMDTRNISRLKREMEPRVSFGRDWLKNSVAELYKDNVSRFNLLFAQQVENDSLKTLKEGKTPGLDALRLHNGTVYRWNRACYGVSPNGQPHLRIENRYIPSGPTVIDELANTAFWLGLMRGLPERYENIDEQMKFTDVRLNFYNAARMSLDTNFYWLGKSVTARELLMDELLPIAYKGLQSVGIDQADIERLLGIIEERVKAGVNGSKWMERNFTSLLDESTPSEASANLTKILQDQEERGLPVHLWDDIDLDSRNQNKRFRLVRQVMSTDVPTVQEDDLLDLVINIMDWRSERYVAVENQQQELVGLMTSSRLIHFMKQDWDEEHLAVKDIMIRDLITIGPDTPTAEAVKIMADNDVGCLPVVLENKLLGIINERDIVKVASMTAALERQGND